MVKKKVKKPAPTKLFLLEVAGAEISRHGPYRDEEDRLGAAQGLWQSMDPTNGDNLFKLNVQNNNPTVSVFVDGDLDEE